MDRHDEPPQTDDASSLLSTMDIEHTRGPASDEACRDRLATFARTVAGLARERAAKYKCYGDQGGADTHKHDPCEAAIRVDMPCDIVCADWRHIVRQHVPAGHDEKGLRLCIAAVDRLGVTVHTATPLCLRDNQWAAAMADDPLFPKMRDPLRDQDDVLLVGDTAIGRIRRHANADAHDFGLEHRETKTTHILLACSNKVAPDGAYVVNADRKRPSASVPCMGLKVCIAIDRQPWAAAGSVVNLDTGRIIALGCVLVSKRPFDDCSGGESTMCMKRRRLADFLASGDGTWETFAERRYLLMRQLPMVLAQRGWIVAEQGNDAWTWPNDAKPNAEYKDRIVRIKRGDMPVRVHLFLRRGRLIIVSGGWTSQVDAIPLDVPGVFASDPHRDVVYVEKARPLNCAAGSRWYEAHNHFEKSVAAQRASLVDMDLVTPAVFSGRKYPYRQRVTGHSDMHEDSDCGFFGPTFAFYAIAHQDLDKVGDVVEAHVAQSIFGEYGPIEPTTGQHLNAGLCDKIVDEAIESGRLWADLACIAGVSCEVTEAPIDPMRASGMCRALDTAGSQSLIVNWRAKFEVAYYATTSCKRPKKLPLAIWAALVVQTDGRGDACVVLSVPASKACALLEHDESTYGRVSQGSSTRIVNTQSRKDGTALFGDDVRTGDHIASDDDKERRDDNGDGADIAKDYLTWRALVGRCALAGRDLPPGLYPPLKMAIQTEATCNERACFVPWAYFGRAEEEEGTGDDYAKSAIDVRLATHWVVDRVTEILTVLDAQLAPHCAGA